MSTNAVIHFEYEKETKNKVRFTELGMEVKGNVKEQDPPIIGKLYVDKVWLEAHDSPRELKVTLGMA